MRTMSAVGVASIAMGILILCARGPFLVAPVAALRFTESLIETNTRIRILGGIVLPLGVLMVWAGTAEHSILARVLVIWGWANAGIGLLALLLFPDLYRVLVTAFLPVTRQESFAGWRFIGFIGVAIGVLMIYGGVEALCADTFCLVIYGRAWMGTFLRWMPPPQTGPARMLEKAGRRRRDRAGKQATRCCTDHREAA